MKTIAGLNKDREILIAREKLLGMIKANAAVHKQEYEEALAAWRAKTKERLMVFAQEILIQAENIDSADTLSLQHGIGPKPMSYLKAYEDALVMFSMDTRDEIKLSTSEFGAYVMDEWDWMNTFKSVHSMYTAP